MVQDKSVVGALAGDPRRPDSVVPFKRPPPQEDKLDVLATAGMVLGLVGMLTKVRLFSFAAIAFIVSAFIQSGPDSDMKQLMMSAMFAVAGIFFSHLQPQSASAAASEATRAAAQAQAEAAAANAAAFIPAGQA